MPAIQIRIAVELEGEQPYEVLADQRDIARWEAWEGCVPGRKHTTTRYIAWAASKRQGLTKLGWPAFDAELIEASDAFDDAEDEELDPTKPAQSAGS